MDLCYRVTQDARGAAFPWHLVATVDIRPGTQILVIEGVESRSPTRHSIQFGPTTHIAPPDDLIDGSNTSLHQSGDFGWRYLDHSCDPNCVLEGRTLVARRPIARGEKICFDYESTEHTLSEPFRCACGTCDGRMIRGFALADPNPRRVTRE